MKIRPGFVSNSSSSSFVVIGNQEDVSSSEYNKIINCGVMILGQEGETGFGWDRLLFMICSLDLI